MSLAILQAQINMQMTQPTLSVWYDDTLSEAFLLKAAECVKTGVGYPAFFNLKTYVAHELKTSGLPVEVIRKHAAMGGCTEPVLQGMSYGVVQAGFVNHGKLIDLTMNDGVDPVTGIRLFDPRPVASYEDVETSYLDKMHAAVRHWQQYWNYVMVAHRDTVPLVFCSVFVRDCLSRGLCMDDGGAVQNGTPTTLSSGLVNVANSLAVIRRLCFEDKRLHLRRAEAAVADDWQGHDMLRKRALAVPKWGNDDDDVDGIFLDLFDDYCRWVAARTTTWGARTTPPCWPSRRPCPSARPARPSPTAGAPGSPLADGVTSPFPGTDTRGPTAVVRSSGKVDHTRIRGGLLNLKFHPTALKGRERLAEPAGPHQDLLRQARLPRPVQRGGLADAARRPGAPGALPRPGGARGRVLRLLGGDEQGAPGPGHLAHRARVIKGFEPQRRRGAEKDLGL